MKITLLLILAVTLASFSLLSPERLQKKQGLIADTRLVKEFTSIVTTGHQSLAITPKPFHAIETMLRQDGSLLKASVINKVLTTLTCANEYHVNNNNILVIIDYSLPSSEKRLWVFDLMEKKLLFNTYVSHGIKSGTLLSNYFSNKYNSKSSSIGVYKTEQVYRGRHGLSLKLLGLDRGFNDNAANRSVVMHGGWYVDEDFIKKYGRAGRSWGCPAVPENLTEPIINTIKDNALFVVYYPSDDWFLKSKFLNCNRVIPTQNVANVEITPSTDDPMFREDVLFADRSKHSKIDDTPIVAMEADNYERIFHDKAPLERMLRRQINHVEYIALSNTEFKNMIINNNNLEPNHDNDGLNAVCFIVPVVKMDRGYYGTEMKRLNMGKIKDVTPHMTSLETTDQIKSYTVYFEAHPPINLSSTNQFIRWLGL